MQQAAQGQQPSAAEQALQAQAQESQSKAALNAASAEEKKASANLKEAQAMAVGGPASEPDTPTGLHEVANDIADIHKKVASANLDDAKAAHLRHEMGLKSIQTGRELAEGGQEAA
jgi:hypothetical protein